MPSIAIRRPAVWATTPGAGGHNLGWKLAYAVKGWAGPKLLESYSQERAPVGKQVVQRANQSRLDYAQLNACFRVQGAENPVAAGIMRFRDAGPDGVAARKAAQAALDLKQTEYNAQGVEMNQRYESSAVIPDEETRPEEWLRDRDLYNKPTTRPGAKIPHAWLVGPDGMRMSTLDVTGRGLFTLVTGLAGTAWKEAVRRLDLPFLRIADDLVILIDAYKRHDWLVGAVDKRLREEFGKLQVEINDEKSRTVDLERGECFGFLGFEFRYLRGLSGAMRPHYTPKLKKRTALVRALKEVFGRHRSQPIERVIALINPVLRGWVNYFAVGHSSECFSFIKDWVEKKVRRHLAHAQKRKGFGWERWKRRWLYDTLGLFNAYRVRRDGPKVAPAG
jgi:hypothetical protein